LLWYSFCLWSLGRLVASGLVEVFVSRVGIHGLPSTDSQVVLVFLNAREQLSLAFDLTSLSLTLSRSRSLAYATHSIASKPNFAIVVPRSGLWTLLLLSAAAAVAATDD